MSSYVETCGCGAKVIADTYTAVRGFRDAHAPCRVQPDFDYDALIDKLRAALSDTPTAPLERKR